MLEYLANTHPDHVGEIVYLFVFGELIDAYQNRSMLHEERVRIVLRTHFFIDAWLAHLETLKYPKAQHAPSREALDILNILIEGYLALLYIHRDHIDGITPLLCWLHSSEACEHCFGEARRIVKDFTILDFMYMVPKLRTKMRQVVLHQKASDPKARASGYSYTSFDMTGLDQLNLATFPSDEIMEDCAQAAAEESDSLIRLLGMYPAQLRKPSQRFHPLPAIDSWYLEPHATATKDESLDNSDSDGDFETDYGSDEDDVAGRLMYLIERAHDYSVVVSQAQEEEISNLIAGCARARFHERTTRIIKTKKNGQRVPAASHENKLSQEEQQGAEKISQTLENTTDPTLPNRSEPKAAGHILDEPKDHESNASETSPLHSPSSGPAASVAHTPVCNQPLERNDSDWTSSKPASTL